MAFDGKGEIGGRHASPIVGDLDQSAPAAVGEHVDARCRGIKRVLDELLRHACRTFHHLAGGNAIDDTFGELTNGHGRHYSEGRVIRVPGTVRSPD